MFGACGAVFIDENLQHCMRKDTTVDLIGVASHLLKSL
jgi:hypothetical protein